MPFDAADDGLNSYQLANTANMLEQQHEKNHTFTLLSSYNGGGFGKIGEYFLRFLAVLWIKPNCANWSDESLLTKFEVGFFSFTKLLLLSCTRYCRYCCFSKYTYTFLSTILIFCFLVEENIILWYLHWKKFRLTK